MEIHEDNLTGGQIIDLIRTHLDYMAQFSPPESIHALDVAALQASNVTFWSAWDGSDILGCAALKELHKTHGEIKSMHTAAKHRGKQIGQALLTHVTTEAKRRGYQRLSLETGSGAGFEPALGLYRKAGFVVTAPFADYQEDPFSTFMTRELP